MVSLLASRVVDDWLLVDSVFAGHSGQQFAAIVFNVIGAPLANEQRKEMSSVATFLGMEHSLAVVATLGIVTFWVKQYLRAKCEALTQGHQESGSMTPAQASKRAGILCFLAQGVYNRTGMAGMAPLW